MKERILKEAEMYMKIIYYMNLHTNQDDEAIIDYMLDNLNIYYPTYDGYETDKELEDNLIRMVAIEYVEFIVNGDNVNSNNKFHQLLGKLWL